MVEQMGSEHLERGREMSDLEAQANEMLLVLLDPLGLDKVETFEPTEFGRGVAAGLEQTGIGLATLAFYLSSYPQETQDVIGDDLLDLMENPEQVLGETSGLLSNLGEEWWLKTESEEFEHFSYDVGKIIGVLLSRLLTKGVGSVESMVYLTPASGQAQRLLFLGQMAQEEYGPDVREALAAEDDLLVSLWDEMNSRMINCYDPHQQEAYAECMKNMYLNSKDPSEYPIKLDTVRFIRDEFAEVLYRMVQYKEIDANALLNFIESFSAMGAVMMGRFEMREDEALGFNIFDPGYPPSRAQVNGMNIGYNGMKRAIEAGETPPKESFLVLTNSILQYYFGGPSSIETNV